MAELSASNGGTGRLVEAIVYPQQVENLPARASMVQALLAGDLVFSTDARLRFRHLMSVDTATALDYRAAARDHNGQWTEWSDEISHSAGVYSPGATEASIGSGTSDIVLVEEPDVTFPDLSVGSGLVQVYRTIVSDGFYDEARRNKWVRSRAAFNVVMENLDEDQVARLHRFFEGLNGPLKPFYFDFKDPKTHVTTRHVVRFREGVLNDELFDVDRSDINFTLIECVTWNTAAAA
jgi:hypothetical protein